MTEIELIEYVNKLETIFDKHLSEIQMQMWVQRFCSYHPDDFGRAIENIIHTRERFPQLSTVYTALREVNAGSPGKNNLIPAHPFCSYIGNDGHTSVWWNSTGQAFGNPSPADDAPEEFDNGDGVARLFDVSGDDGHKVMKRWGIYREYRLGREALLDGMVREVERETSGLDEAGVEERKKELLGG